MINLPPPHLHSQISLEEAISKRRSVRNFKKRNLTEVELSQLLWSAQGETKDEFRAAPSAGATYPIELYVIKNDGMYHYIPSFHSLEKIDDSDLRTELAAICFGQECVKQASANIVMCLNSDKLRYGDRGRQYAYLEAGHIAQNTHLQATAICLGSVAVGAFNDEQANQLMKQDVIYIVAVGEEA